MQHYTQAIITILALVNPAICAQMFADATRGQSKSQQYKESIKSVLTIATVLLIAAFAGTSVLQAFGISLPAFSCAGGGILIWIGVQMIISAQRPPLPASDLHSTSSHKTTGLVLFAASPGTITGVITVAASHHDALIPYTAVIGVAIAMLVLLGVLMAFIALSKEQKEPTMVKKMITSYMGVIVIAMGAQFMLSGVKNFLF
ncbi:MarC family protein [Vibrio litoralis]|uniref:MarC family protein n=1 Tax=Vibrio litoralis TaxID=335972 RepID=UPI0003F58144|nr:MarC family protein [Vibrio litoralis]